MEIKDLEYCSIYVFDKTSNTIYPIECNDYDKNIHIVIKNKTLNELSKINNENIKKTIMSIPNYKKKYFHVTYQPFSSKIEDMNEYNYSWLSSRIYYNPLGIWLSCGTSWQEFLSNSVDRWTLSTYIYQIVPTDTVLKISTLKAFKEFIDKYKKKTKVVSDIINWKKVKEDYDGLIICPYLGDKIWGKNATSMNIGVRGKINKWDEYVNQILGKEWKNNIIFTAEWYRHWETGTGVIWKPSTGLKKLKLIKKLDTFDHLNN
jgi:hypothetical protein